MRRRPTPGYNRKKKRRELLHVISRQRDAITTLKEERTGFPFDCAIPYEDPMDRLDVEKLRGEFYLPMDSWRRTVDAGMFDMGIRRVCTDIGGKLYEDRRLLDIQRQDQPEQGRQAVRVTLMIAKTKS